MLANKQIIFSSIVGLISLMITACGSSPNAKFYLLNAIDRDTPVSARTGQHSIAVKVGPISIPDTLDQAQIVTRPGPNKLILDEFNRWGGDLQNDIQRVLGENISILLATDFVILDHELSMLPIDFQVLVNIRELSGELGGLVRLNADWTVLGLAKQKTVIAKKSVIETQAEGVEYQNYVAAQSLLLAKLSQEITDVIRQQLGNGNVASESPRHGTQSVP